MGKSIGGDELIQLMEHVIACASLANGWSVIRRMEGALDDDTLLHVPDLDGALQGFLVPCRSVVMQALVRWRSASLRGHCTTVARPLHDCHTAVTRLLHDCCTIVT